MPQYLLPGDRPWLGAFWLCLWGAAAAIAAEPAKTTYDDHVQPIFRQHCAGCHNADDRTSDLVLDTFEGALTGGAGGEVLVGGNPAESRLWKLAAHLEQPTMPPEDKLSEEDLATLRAWIVGGLLQRAESKPITGDGPALHPVAVAARLGKPAGEPALPTGLFHEPVLSANRPGAVDALATSPWAPLAVVAWQRQVSFYHTQTHELLGILPYLDGLPRVVRFSRDGSLLLVAGGQHAASGSASVFDVKTGARLARVGDELDIVMAADISPDGTLVALGGPGKKVRVYHTASGALGYECTKHTDWITALQFSPDGTLLATADRLGSARLWQSAAGHPRGELRGHTQAVTALDWRSDSALLATASEDNTVRLWNAQGKPVKSIGAHAGGVRAVRFAKDGRLLSAGRDRKLKTWKPDGGPLAEVATLNQIALAAEFTHDGRHVLASDYAGSVGLFDLSTKKKVAALVANPPTLTERRTAAEARLAEVAARVAQCTADWETAVAARDAAETAHANHAEKIATAETKLASLEDNRETSELARAEVAQARDAATETRQQAELSLAAAQEALDAHAAKNHDDPEVAAAEKSKLAQQYSERLEAEKRAQQVQRSADAELVDAARLVADGETAIAGAQSAIRSLADEATNLPDLDHLLARSRDAQTAMELALGERTRAAGNQARIIAHRLAFESAAEQLAATAQTAAARSDGLAEQLARQQTQQVIATEQLAQRRAETKRLESALEDLQGRLGKTRKARDEVAQLAKTHQQQLAKLQQEHRAAERRKHLSEARRQAFEAAERVRKKYATLP